jgi:uncharacterized protein (DUF983 family)
MQGDAPEPNGQPGIAAAALFGFCPRCGGRTLFDGAIRFAPRCRACGVDFARFNVGDGPAAFITLVVGALLVALAIWVEVTFTPPFWIHIVLWLPLTVAAVIWGLRVGKAALLAIEYQRKAGEAGRGE